ncbi:MAG TPA: flagellar basal body P-ring protein FlgI [Acidobacteriaceae bacterium]|nr:flagellar basal body P-ring protein FlgI [Acidobacteriaceae bacterium]
MRKDIVGVGGFSWRVLAFAILLAFALHGSAQLRQVHIRDITDVQGIRDNQLIGYGLVVGLAGTGDRQQTYFTIQTLANMLQKMGVQIPTGTAIVKNVAAVMVTTQVPPFAEPGMKIDITVSSVGDAKSIEGGVLLLTALRGADGQVYAEAQGPLTTGGYSESAAGNVREVNYPTVGVIADGAIIERAVSMDIRSLESVKFLLRQADFTASRDVADAINKDFGAQVANVVDSREIDVDAHTTGMDSIPRLISRIQNLSVGVQPRARVVVNERTGTIVLGGDVLLSPVSVLHGGLQIQVDTVVSATQAAPGSSAAPAVVTNTAVQVQDKEASSIRLAQGADVEELVKGLHTIGATAHDIVSILEAVKAAGGLQAELVVI